MGKEQQRAGVVTLWPRRKTPQPQIEVTGTDAQGRPRVIIAQLRMIQNLKFSGSPGAFQASGRPKRLAGDAPNDRLHCLTTTTKSKGLENAAGRPFPAGVEGHPFALEKARQRANAPQRSPTCKRPGPRTEVLTAGCGIQMLRRRCNMTAKYGIEIPLWGSIATRSKAVKNAWPGS